MNKEEKRIAEQLELYIDQPEAYEGHLDPALERVVDSLRESATQRHPRPGYLNELAQQLQERERAMTVPQKRNVLRAGVRLVMSGLGLAGVLLFALYVVGVFRQPEVEPALSDVPTREANSASADAEAAQNGPTGQDRETREPSLSLEGTGGQFTGVKFDVLPELDDSTTEMAMYQAKFEPVASTPEEAKALGAAMGMTNPKVYTEAGIPNSWVVIDDAGNKLHFYRAAGASSEIYYEGVYYDGVTSEEGGEPLTFEAAREVAVKFLEAGGLLPAEYVVTDASHDISYGMRLVNIEPRIEGRVVHGGIPWAQVAVSPDARVSSAHFSQIVFQPANETRPTKSARQAFEELLNGAVESTYWLEYVHTNEQISVYFPEPAQAEPGQEVTLLGWANVYIGLDDGEVRATFNGMNSAHTYELTGDKVDELRDHSQAPVKITGVVHDAGDGSQPQLEVRAWEPSTEVVGMSLASECRSGTFVREGDKGLLQTEDGQTFELASPPEALENEAQIEVCAEAFPEGNVIDWQHIQSPPSGELTVGAWRYANSGGSSRGEAGYRAADVMGIITGTVGTYSHSATVAIPNAEPGVIPKSGNALTVQADPRRSPVEPLFEVGETVEVSGIVDGVIRMRDGERQPELVLEIEMGDSWNSGTQGYPLTGDPELLEELSQHYRLHVTISGVVVESQDKSFGPGGQAIEVKSYTRPWHEETMQAFLGHLGTLVVDNQEMTLFTDEATGQEYVLRETFGAVNTQQRIWLSGVVHPEWQIAGRPVLMLHQQVTGPEVDAAESAGDVQLDNSMPVVEDIILSTELTGIEGTVIIDRVELGYSLSSKQAASQNSETAGEITELEPVWLFYGHSEDGTVSFVLEVSALAE